MVPKSANLVSLIIIIFSMRHLPPRCFSESFLATQNSLANSPEKCRYWYVNANSVRSPSFSMAAQSIMWML
ncbi:hypothetical protein F5Y19DRAFT_443934 [Xylariaceae sp. FL1651]|nr:hypothetical protein F5Y19DRAFT_443934 [Xylariaceae sp. FL1651]